MAVLASMLASAALAAPEVAAENLSEFKVELPTELRKMAGRGQLSPVTHALVTIAIPNNIDRAHGSPVIVISATSGESSRRLLRAYADTALAAGWTLVAADPAENVAVEQDDVPMRLALNTAALAVLARHWPESSRAPLAFAGFSGGAKYSGWLAAAFAGQGRTVIGIYLAGINQETLVDAARQFDVLNAAFKRTPVFLQTGTLDDVSSPADHQAVASDLRRAGFRNVRVEYFTGAHEVEPRPMRAALEWFRESAALPSPAK